MTTTPEPLENKVNQLESALGRLAELSFNNAQRHDQEITQLLEVTRRNSEAVTRHDQAIAQLIEVTTRNSQAVSQRDNEMTQLLEVTRRTSESVTRHDDALNRMENAIANLTNRLDTFIERSDAERETFIDEIRQIWRYLRYEPGNGTSHSDNG